MGEVKPVNSGKNEVENRDLYIISAFLAFSTNKDTGDTGKQIEMIHLLSCLPP